MLLDNNENLNLGKAFERYKVRRYISLLKNKNNKKNFSIYNFGKCFQKMYLLNCVLLRIFIDIHARLTILLN